ncbi:MAG: hypothetical protein ACT4QD_03460 [Acidobacteriota bacterium]
MSETAELWLGVIAVAVVVMAVIQVGVIVAGVYVARRVDRVARDLESSIKPLIGNLTAISADASRTAQLAMAQVERFDRTFADVTGKVEQTVSAAHHFISGPARNGLAILAGLRAALNALHAVRESSRRRAAEGAAAVPEAEEESLFIG